MPQDAFRNSPLFNGYQRTLAVANASSGKVGTALTGHMKLTGVVQHPYTVNPVSGVRPYQGYTLIPNISSWFSSANTHARRGRPE